ncbi:MAG: ferrous iron transport protein B [Bacillota bacterium]|nr:MAG: ferrous iron transport protein B [Bacillota bacterium]
MTRKLGAPNARSTLACHEVPAGRTPADRRSSCAGRVVALAGNPNSGKTSLFNALTGANQVVGNWPGVTVERKEGRSRKWGISATVVDLPGTYDLTGQSADEAVARDYILSGEADVIVNVVDGANLERHLYLSLRLLEMGTPLVVALNMMDEARGKGMRINTGALSRRLGVPVVETVATRGQGVGDLLRAAMGLAGEGVLAAGQGNLKVDYGPAAEREIAGLAKSIDAARAEERGREPGGTSLQRAPARWLAAQLLEGDASVTRFVETLPEGPAIQAAAAAGAARLESELGEDVAAHTVRRRFEVARELAEAVVFRVAAPVAGTSVSDRVDRFVTHPLLGAGLLLGVMWAVFKFTFTAGAPLTGLAAGLVAALGSAFGRALGALDPGGFLASFVVDGLVAGVGSVIVFVPPVFLLFFALSVLEESGYMARAACVTDGFMRSLGLQGKAFIPLVLGFGCNVPAILAARTLESPRDRLTTILISPLMSCSARLPVYTLFAGAFFGARQGLVVFSLYLLGVIMAVVMARLLTRRLLPGESSDFVLELPPYRLPSLTRAARQMWFRGSAFIRKAGTMIALGVVVMWGLSSLPWGVDYAGADSLLGRLGSVLAPLLEPAGFGRWQAAAALIFGVLAKEFVVAAMGLVYGAGEQALPALLALHFTPLAATAFMVMALLYVPCVATVAAIRRESGSWRWAVFAVGYSLLLGWGMAVVVYQVGRLLGLA